MCRICVEAPRIPPSLLGVLTASCMGESTGVGEPDGSGKMLWTCVREQMTLRPPSIIFRQGLGKEFSGRPPFATANIS